MRAHQNDPTAAATNEALRLFTGFAAGLHGRGHAAGAVARLRDRLIVCLFARVAGLVSPERVDRAFEGDADAMVALFRAVRDVGRFDGGLFADDEILPLELEDLRTLRAAAGLDWGAVEPAILGTLFERGLEPTRRSQLGAHYTDREAILRILDPVLLGPLRAELATMQAAASEALAQDRTSAAADRLDAFLRRLRGVRVLDPSCGAGSFLYLALQGLQAIERAALVWAAQRFAGIVPAAQLGCEVVLGIERDPATAELARFTLWVAEIQRRSACRGDMSVPELPGSITCKDAILEISGDGQPVRPVWPEAEFIVGNPPFLGGKKLRAELGDPYVDRLFVAWQGCVPREADLVAYWHEAAREQIAGGRSRRAALLATQGIRGGANLEVLRKIKQTGDIFMAWSDQPWVVEGATVRISMIAQDDGSERQRSLDGAPVAVIHADLTGGVHGTPDVSRARRLRENLGVAFMGDTKGGKFELSPADAARLLGAVNESGRPNSEVVVPWVNGLDITRRPRGMHIIDFAVDMPEASAARYVGPFAHVRKHVAPARALNRRDAYRERWWIHVEPRPALRAAIRPLRRFLVTPTVARHRVFVWLTRPTLPDHQLIVIAREDDYCFGVLQSRIHELWSLRMCTWLGAGNDPRYTPTTTFETFPFPWPLDTPDDHLSSEQRRHRDTIAAAAGALHEARQRWLFPAELDTGEHKRTLTSLYRGRPAWLADAHARLDSAVAAAYGWPCELGDDEILARLLVCNGERPARGSKAP